MTDSTFFFSCMFLFPEESPLKQHGNLTEIKHFPLTSVGVIKHSFVRKQVDGDSQIFLVVYVLYQWVKFLLVSG